MTRRNTLLLSALLSLSAVTATHATGLTWSAVTGGGPAGAGLVTTDFASLSLGTGPQAIAGGSAVITFATTGGGIVNGSSGTYAAPYVTNGAAFGQASGPDANNYASSGVGMVAIDFATAQTSFGLLWGSVDAYNTLSFYNGSTLIGSITGTQAIAPNVANGDRGANGTYYVNVNSSTAFTEVVASSTQYAFEFDDIAYSANAQPVPEPATLGLLSLGLAGAGFLRRRKAAKA